MDRKYLKVGTYVPETEEKEAVIQREYYRQGWIFKDEAAFLFRMDQVCYVPELSDEGYTRQGFMDLCNGQGVFAEECFRAVDWQCPETWVDEQYREDEWGYCPVCGWNPEEADGNGDSEGGCRAAYNPRRDLKPGDKDYEKLKRSIAEFGFVEPVVWNERTGFVVGGHQRLKVLLDMGVTEIDCVVVDLEPEREKALNVALNRIQGDWDEGKLAEVLADIDASAFDVSFTGFDAEEMDALMNKFYSADAEEDGFDREAAAEKVEASGGAVTVPGDIWQLGGHRLLCGNGADAGAMGLLMGKERAACAVCAPPAVSMEEYKKDGMEPWISRMGDAVSLLCRYADIVCWNVDDLFSTGSQYMEPVAFESMKLFADCNFRPLWIRVWKKQGIMARAGSAHLSSAKPQRQFEYVAAFGGGADEEVNEQEYGWVSAFAAHSYRFVKRLTKEERRKWGYAGVWEIASMPAGADGVPMVPVELPWRCMKMHSDPGGLVLDPFAGGGTVLIAAEQSERRCFAMEGDPLKCDLIVMRWEQFTGEKAVRLGAADAGPENEGE